MWGWFHSPCFDVSVWEVFGALSSGGRVVVVPPGVARVPAELAGLLVRERVAVLCQTPSAFYQLAAAGGGRGLDLVVLAGEAVDAGPGGGVGPGARWWGICTGRPRRRCT